LYDRAVQMGIAPRMALYVSLILAAVIVVLTAIQARQSGRILEDLMGARCKAIAATLALTIDGDRMEAIHTKDDAKTESYRTLRQMLADVARVNDVRPDLVYTLRPRNDAYELVVMADESRNDIGDPYHRAPAELAEVLADGRPRHRGIYETEHGKYISGFAAIRNHDHAIVGLLEVDYEISAFISEMRRNGARAIAVAGVILLAGVLSMFFAVRAVTSRIVRLTALADAISKGDVERPVTGMGKDEVGRLASALERLRESVRTSLELLRDQKR
jgi:methyl-accepting chemotaxis protein